MQFKFVSIDRIFSKLLRDFDIPIEEGHVVEWCGEALEFIGAVKQYEEAIAFVEVKNHQCAVPLWTHAIIQIARDNHWSRTVKEQCTLPSTVVESICSCTSSTKQPRTNLQWCDTREEYVLLDCNGEIIYDYNLAYYRPYFDLRWEYDQWRGSRLCQTRYTPVRLTESTLFSSIVCKENDQSIYTSCKDEYTIVNGDTIRFSFREGMVAIPYLRQVVDEKTGYPMVPDHVSYSTAITKYIMYKLADKEFSKGRQGSGARLEKYESDWHWYCKQAGNAALIPNGIDDHQNLLDQRSYILPQMNAYHSFFGRLNNSEDRRYKDPNGTNTRFIYG